MIVLYSKTSNEKEEKLKKEYLQVFYLLVFFTYFFFAIISNENGECKENQYILYNPFSTFPISKNILYEGIYFSLLPKILSTSS